PDRALRLERFVEPHQVDPLLFCGRSLYLVADGVAAEPAYEVVRQGMRERGRWALGRMVLGGQRQLVLLRATGTLLVLQVLHYPEQVRACPRVAGPERADSSAELALAGQLIDAASGEVDWRSYRDDSAQELRTLLEAKLQGRATADGDATATILP